MPNVTELPVLPGAADAGSPVDAAAPLVVDAGPSP